MNKADTKAEGLDDFWKGRILNLNALSPSDKELYRKIEPILNELLDELKANGKIETAFIPIEMEHLIGLIEKVNRTGINYNLLLGLSDSLDKARRFDEVNAEFGFDESKSTHLYLEVGILSVILYTELFKTVLLFFMKNVNHRVSHFSREMKKAAPMAWSKLKPYVDSTFRNSLAHGIWGIENKMVVLFKNAKLEVDEELDLKGFMRKLKSQNVLYVCLENVIEDKRKAGFFK